MKPQLPFSGWFRHVPLLHKEQYRRSYSLRARDTTAKPKASKHQHHEHVTFKLQCINAPSSGWCSSMFRSPHLPGETTTHSQATQSQSMAMCSSQATRSCGLHLWEELPEECPLGHHLHRSPLHLPGTGACLHSCKPKWAPRASTAQQLYWLFSAEPGPRYFQPEKSLPEFTYTERGERKVCLPIDQSLWTASVIFPCYTQPGKKWDFNRFILNPLKTHKDMRHYVISIIATSDPVCVVKKWARNEYWMTWTPKLATPLPKRSLSQVAKYITTQVKEMHRLVFQGVEPAVHQPEIKRLYCYRLHAWIWSRSLSEPTLTPSLLLPPKWDL